MFGLPDAAGEANAEQDKTFFSDMLGQVRGERLFVAIVAIDRFASLRQRIGHARAAQLVRDVAARARRAIPSARLGRLGRTTIEIAFFAQAEEAALGILRDLQAMLEGDAEIDGRRMDLTLTVGLADSAGPWQDGSELIEQAELALGRAQSAHRKLVLFSGKDHAEAMDRLALVRDLGEACDLGQISLLYQPKLRARTGTVDAVEALIRWNHPARGMVSPDIFIPLAEEYGEIRRLTEWAVARALEDRRHMLSLGHELLVYVNLSGCLLADAGFRRWALERLAGVGGIGFEVTETGVIDDPAGALASLRAYADAGIAIAIDDYGAGWSSLAYLKELPARELKIDRMFISGLASSHRDPLIVRSTIDLAHALEMEVTAEGIEDAATFALLSVMGCDLIQGFLIAKPLPLAELARFLDDLAVRADSGVAQPWARPIRLFGR